MSLFHSIQILVLNDQRYLNMNSLRHVRVCCHRPVTYIIRVLLVSQSKDGYGKGFPTYKILIPAQERELPAQAFPETASQQKGQKPCRG